MMVSAVVPLVSTRFIHSNHETVDDIDDHYVRLAERGVEMLGEAAVPGKWFVDIFPWCRLSHLFDVLLIGKKNTNYSEIYPRVSSWSVVPEGCT